jgi:hypothetical protein
MGQVISFCRGFIDRMNMHRQQRPCPTPYVHIDSDSCLRNAAELDIIRKNGQMLVGRSPFTRGF